MAIVLNKKIYTLDQLSGNIHLATEKHIISFLPGDQSKISLKWVAVAKETFEKLDINEHFDSLAFCGDYIEYLKDQNIIFSIEIIKAIEEIQRIFSLSKSSNGFSGKIEESLLLGLQNWLLIHLAIEKNPESVAKYFKTQHVFKIIESFTMPDISNEVSDYVLDRISKVIKLSDRYLYTKNTAIGKYLKLLLENLKNPDDKKCVVNLIPVAQKIHSIPDKNIDGLLKNHFHEIYRLMLLWEDLKII